MWFIFPQIAGLGYSETARYYAIRDMGEAKAYMEDDTLRNNLIEISEALLEAASDDAGVCYGLAGQFEAEVFHDAVCPGGAGV